MPSHPRPDVRDWIEGARVRTLPAALAPVIAGTGAAAHLAGARPALAALAALVALALQVGVNFANDYSDGIRGTDAERVGPRRLTASGAVAPRTVKLAAFAAFGVAGLAGLALCLLSGAWWLAAVGAACMVAGWYYTGGRSPYGYQGLGEVAVLVFFGWVATIGTTYTQTLAVSAASVLAGTSIGLLACAILMANNIRDIVTDAPAGKRTLAVRLGDRRARIAYAMMLIAAVAFAVAATAHSPWGWLLLAFALPAALLAGRVLDGARGPALVGVLKSTGILELGIGIGIGLVLAFG